MTPKCVFLESVQQRSNNMEQSGGRRRWRCLPESEIEPGRGSVAAGPVSPDTPAELRENPGVEWSTVCHKKTGKKPVSSSTADIWNITTSLMCTPRPIAHV